MHLTIALILAALGSAFHTPNKRAPSGSLYIADYGVGHRSTPIPRWHTSLRRLRLNGTDPKVLWEYVTDLETPAGIQGFGYEPHGQHFYLATNLGIVRTDIDGSNSVTILKDDSLYSWVSCMIVHGNKLWYGSGYDGLVKRANLDGTGVEVFLNISNGIDFKYPEYNPAKNYLRGIAIDDENNFIYYSDSSSPAIHRVPLQANTSEVETFAQGTWRPIQLRLLPDSELYWVEYGQYIGEVTALKRAYFSPDKPLSGNVKPEILVSTNTTDLLPESITSFAVSEDDGKIWISAAVAASQTSSRILEMGLDGSGLKLLNGNVTQIGVPAGLEYVV
jgi:hypothetical protein